jgi:hypothetical protein
VSIIFKVAGVKQLRFNFYESTSPIQMNLREISSQIGEDSIIKIEPQLFNSSDFKDYTHLNVCGMMKLTKELANRL